MTKNTKNKTNILTLFIIITGAGALSFVLLGNLDYISADSDNLLTGDAVNKIEPVNQNPENDTEQEDRNKSLEDNRSANQSEEDNNTVEEDNLSASYSFESRSGSESSDTDNENTDSGKEQNGSPKPGIETKQMTTVSFIASDQKTEGRKYFWDFGDNQTGRGPEVKHDYSPGFYTVKLTVKDNNTVERTKTKEIEIPEK